jgi:YtkA-like
MEASKRNATPALRRAVLAVAVAGVVAGSAACGHLSMMVGGGPERPAASEFGHGPRTSSKHLYVAALAPSQPLRLRQLQTVAVRIVDGNGRPVEGAVITVDGGMPEHGHGLPTQPRGRAVGGGMYEVEGVRFNMGGWWELKLAIDSPAGADSVTFNLSL